MTRLHTLALLAGLAAAAPALADGGQQTPLTGRMATTPEPSGPAAAAVANASTPEAPVAPAVQAGVAAPPASPLRQPAPGVGQATRSLLQLQASGTQAAPARPMLGDQAAASYRRYLDSFSHPIPEFFRTTIQDARQSD